LAPRIFLSLLSVCFGAVFIYSAYTKLNPVQVFEYTLVEFMHLPWWLSAILARLMTGIEIAIGALAILHFYGTKKWLLSAAIILLILFNAYLAYIWINFGNRVNCGCFGDAIWMNPGASILKNCILIIAAIVLFKYRTGWKFTHAQKLTSGLFLILTFLPFFLFAIPENNPVWLKKDKFPLPLSAAYEPDNKITPSADILHGKHIIAFISPLCPHCRMAAHKMHIMKTANPSLPFFFIIGGTDSDLTDFWKETKSQNIPFSRMKKNQFLSFTGGIFPQIYWVEDTTVVAKSTYLDLDQAQIEKWLSVH